MVRSVPGLGIDFTGSPMQTRPCQSGMIPQIFGRSRRQSAKLFQLKASNSLARLWREQGKRAKARDLLGPIYNWFTEDFDAPDLKDAKALLDALA